MASLTFTAGSDAITSIGFGDTADISVTGLDGELIWSTNDAGELEGRTEAGGDAVLTLTLSSSGPVAAGEEQVVTVTATLAESLAHVVDADSLSITGISVVGTDTDGTSTEAVSRSAWPTISRPSRSRIPPRLWSKARAPTAPGPPTPVPMVPR
ncbi:hypothetical protein [Halomonas sp. DN3]|uniref:hypothetical protein n=1 Tax=Halomonas sp. DN3 TaxID=2953657 RepID=UPI00209CF456|nr:hypothetical protein [Halomonas sp. DN3]USZ51600.1 hypothetical protein NKF27_08940 [Halomonas sp. DN3]